MLIRLSAPLPAIPFTRPRDTAPGRKGLFLLAIPNSFATGIYFVVFPPFVRRVLAGSAEYYSWTVTLQAAGAIAGGLLIGMVRKRLGPRALVAGSLLFLGFLALMEVLAVRQSVTLAVSLLVGIPSVVIGATLNALLQAGTEDAYLGRVYGGYITATNLALLMGTVTTTLTTDYVGVRLVFASGSVVLILAGLTAMKVLL